LPDAINAAGITPYAAMLAAEAAVEAVRLRRPDAGQREGYRSESYYLAALALSEASSLNDEAADAVKDGERAAQCVLLRDLFGPFPLHPVTVQPDVLAWNGRLVVRLAQAIYDERRWGDMPLLGDALLDAGCDNEEVLAHCRAGGEHIRGCWVLDLCLGRG
jgi:hypothetical protein